MKKKFNLEIKLTSWNVDSKYDDFSLFGCRTIAVKRMNSITTKKVKIITVPKSFAARWCPANICIAQRKKPLRTKLFSNLFLLFPVFFFLLNKAIRYFVILAECTVGYVWDGRNNSLIIGPGVGAAERKTGSSVGW
jgi:hypothetical protein